MSRTPGKRSRKKRPPKLDERQVRQLGKGQGYLGGVVFDLEPDAEDLFLKSLESMDVSAIRKAHRDAEDPPKEKNAKSRPAKGREILELDLHSLHLDAAIRRVDEFILDVTAHLKGDVTVKIITGKGLHSGPSGAVLPVEIHRHVKRQYAAIIDKIEESPAEVKVGGVPFRGHFHVRLRK